MNHSKNFEKIKKWYDSGLWSKEQVYKAVEKGQITLDEYKEIVGETINLDIL